MIDIKAKLGEANRCLYVIRGLRKEGYNQEDIDLFFKSVVLSKLTYALPVYGACNAELNVIQSFLNRCFRRHYTSKLFNIHELLEQFDKRLFHKIRVNACHPLHSLYKVNNNSLDVPRYMRPYKSRSRTRNCDLTSGSYSQRFPS